MTPTIGARSVAMVAVCIVSACGGAFQPELRERATTLARGELGDVGRGCGEPRLEPLDDWSYRAENACGGVVYIRCGVERHHPYPGRLVHVDCHSHATAAEVVGAFHPHDAGAFPPGAHPIRIGQR